jgi:pimeloyl-ACP methyl ester carboxylesterase
MLKSDFQKTALNYAESFLFLPQSDRMAKKRVMHAFSNADSSIALATLESLFNYGVNEANRLSRLKQKLYLINSDSSPTNVESLEATGVPFEVVDIHATGHYPMIEKPELFNQMLEKVLNKIYHNGS